MELGELGLELGKPGLELGELGLELGELGELDELDELDVRWAHPAPGYFPFQMEKLAGILLHLEWKNSKYKTLLCIDYLDKHSQPAGIGSDRRIVQAAEQAAYLRTHSNCGMIQDSLQGMI